MTRTNVRFKWGMEHARREGGGEGEGVMGSGQLPLDVAGNSQRWWQLLQVPQQLDNCHCNIFSPVPRPRAMPTLR